MDFNVHYHGSHFKEATYRDHCYTLNQLKVSLGEWLNSSASPWTLNSPHSN